MEEGGLNLLDITSRNEVIEIIWLKAYLNISLTRPKWAKIMDTLIDAVAPQGSNMPMRINMFLQTWEVNTRGMHHQTLNNDMTRMLNAAKNQNMNLVIIGYLEGPLSHRDQGDCRGGKKTTFNKGDTYTGLQRRE